MKDRLTLVVEPVEVPASWYPDPEGGHEYRYWDGQAWSDNVADAGQSSVAPLASPGQVAPPVVVPATTLVFDEAAGGDVRGAPFDIRTLDGASYGQARSPQQSVFSTNMSLKTIVTEVRDPAGTLLFTHSDLGGLGNNPDVVTDPIGRELGRLQVHLGVGSVGVDVFADAQLMASVKSRGMPLDEFWGRDTAGVDVVRYTTRLRDDADFRGRADRWWVETLVRLPAAQHKLLLATVFTLNARQDRSRASRHSMI
jgi:Protein of unknown function (DUF2510)